MQETTIHECDLENNFYQERSADKKKVDGKDWKSSYDALIVSRGRNQP